MARGKNLNIPSNTGVLTKTQFEERETILVLNPNNGVLYVKMQSASDPLTWDWVVPSQSRAYLPGPWLEYGLYYVDQSGAGATGNVTIYETDQHYDVPDYGAIGVARLAQVTTMDVTEGNQPANPGAGIARLWVDTNNFLHILTPGGADYVVTDTATALGGSLTGTLPNPGIAANAVTLMVQSGTFAGQSTSWSSSLANIPGASVTINSRGGPVLILAGFSAFMSAAGFSCTFALMRDSVNINNIAKLGGTTDTPVFFGMLDSPAAGNHTYQIAWQVSGSVINMTSSINSFFYALEIDK